MKSAFRYEKTVNHCRCIMRISNEIWQSMVAHIYNKLNLVLEQCVHSITHSSGTVF